MKYALICFLFFVAGHISGLYWHIKTAKRIINEALEK